MAIEITNVFSTDMETNVQNLAAWLQEHAVPDCFDSVEVITEGLHGTSNVYGIRCTVDGAEFMMIEFQAAKFKELYFATENEAAKSTISCASSPLYAYKCYKLGGGMVIQFGNNTPVDACTYAFAITKDSDGNTVVMATSGMNSYATVSYPILLASRKAVSLSACRCAIGTESRGKTVLSPILMYDDADRTLPYAFAVPYYQHTIGAFAQITVDGVDAIYCAGWCLKDQ